MGMARVFLPRHPPSRDTNTTLLSRPSRAYRMTLSELRILKLDSSHESTLPASSSRSRACYQFEPSKISSPAPIGIRSG